MPPPTRTSGRGAPIECGVHHPDSKRDEVDPLVGDRVVRGRELGAIPLVFYYLLDLDRRRDRRFEGGEAGGINHAYEPVVGFSNARMTSVWP